MSAVVDVPLCRHRFSRAQYEQMIGAGVFEPGERLELLEGEIIDMAPQKSRHATAVTLLGNVLRQYFTGGYTVREQLPLSLDERSEPEPDLTVVRGQPRDYRDAHPVTAALVVEVADTSLAYDRVRKRAVYARAGIPEYWILDLNSDSLEVYRSPDGEDYLERSVFRAGERVMPLAAERGAVEVSEILP